jgi:hypothetical protein
MKCISLSVLLGTAALVLTTNPSWAVSINAFLTNPSFESGTTGWNFSTDPGTQNVYAPDATRYVPGSDGLSGPPRSAPDGTNVASTPASTQVSGAGTFFQITTTNWLPNTTYTLDFYLGVPLGFTAPTTLRVDIGEGIGGGLFQDGLPGPFILSGSQIPTSGNWVLDQITFTTPSSGEFVGKPIGVRFSAVDNNNGQQANWDLTAAAVPGPIVGAGFPGLLLASGSLLALARRRRKST